MAAADGWARVARRATGALAHRLRSRLRGAREGRYADAASDETRERIRELTARNRHSSDSVVDPSSRVTVTMTSHGSRVATTWMAIESIGAGTMRPGRLVLSLSPSDAARLGPELRRLVDRGLEVLLVEDDRLRVHTKWYPISEGLDTPLVTSDDDQLYPPGWLAELMTLHERHPDDVVVHRAHTITLVDGHVQPYLRWTPCVTREPSPRHFGTSVSGQLLPVRVHRAARAAGVAFLDLAPTADDVWLHHIALESGASVRQVRDAPANYPFVPGTQGQGLYQDNVFGGRNDVQIAAVYTPADLERLRLGR